MSNIRRQSIISSIIVYFGFALGFLNTYLFTREGGFTKAQYGLTGTFMAIGTIMFAVASMGMHAYIHKFFPYYKDRLPKTKNDQATWALLVVCGGFAVVALIGFLFKGVVFKIYANSPAVIQYYYWLFPFGLGLTLFSVLEAIGWQYHKSVITNYLREVQQRLFVTILIVLIYVGLINSFDTFIKLYSITFLLLSVILLIYLIKTEKLHFHFTVSKVTRRFYRKIITLSAYIWTGGLVFNFANVFDTIILTAVLADGLTIAGIFTFGQYMTSVMQAPQRGIVAASMAPLSQAWKDKDMNKINRIYHRSSINQLSFSAAMFLLIWMNFDHGIAVFNIQGDYIYAKDVFLFLGLMRIIDMGTGVNAQIIGTSIYWRFEFFTGIILLALSLCLNYFLTKRYGLIGPAISNLIAFTVYNGIRYVFLLRKFKMQPFTIKSLYALLLAGGTYLVCELLFGGMGGILWIVIRSIVFVALFGAGMFYLNISPDVKPVLNGLAKKLKLRV